MQYTACLILHLPLLALGSPLARRDGCGPSDQSQADTPVDTCNTAVTGPSPNQTPYSVWLDGTTDFSYYEAGGTNRITISPDWPSTCGPSIQGLCNRIQSLPLGQWAWDSTASTCLVGVYLPNIANAAPVPSPQKCLDLILNPMATIFDNYLKTNGMGGNLNRATINIKNLPHPNIPAYTAEPYGDQSHNTPGAPASNGEAVDSGYPSWFMQGGVSRSGPPQGAGQDSRQEAAPASSS